MANFSPPKAYTLTLEAGASRPITGPGVFARVTAATGPFLIGFDLGQTFATALGLSYQAMPGEEFNCVTVENPSATPVRITVVIGRMLIGDDRLNIVTSGNYLPVTEPETKLVGQGIVTLAAAANKILTGAPGAGQYRRAAVCIDNLSATLSLTVYDDAGGVAGSVLPASSRYLPLSGYVKISNDNGAPVACAIGEIWQLSPS